VAALDFVVEEFLQRRAKYTGSQMSYNLVVRGRKPSILASISKGSLGQISIKKMNGTVEFFCPIYYTASHLSGFYHNYRDSPQLN
jgi:hypothetical protein